LPEAAEGGWTVREPLAVRDRNGCAGSGSRNRRFSLQIPWFQCAV